jgi:hypothetical protein
MLPKLVERKVDNRRAVKGEQLRDNQTADQSE